MSKFDVLEKGFLLSLAQEWPQFDEVLRDLAVEFGFEPGHFKKSPLHRRLVENALGGEEGREFLSLGIHRGLPRQKARMVGHRDLVDLRFLLGGEVEDIEGVVGCGGHRRAPGMNAPGHRERNRSGKEDGAERLKQTHQRRTPAEEGSRGATLS